MKVLEQEEADTPKRSRQQEIFKVRAEINRIETKKAMQRNKLTKVGSLRKSTGKTNPYP